MADPPESGDGAPPRVTEVGPWERVDRARHPVALAVALGAVVLLFAVTMVGLGTAIREGDQRVDVPDMVVPEIIGQTEDESRAQLEELGLIMVVEESPNELLAAGSVFDQQPIAGAKVELGSPVTASVSTGPAGAIVPETVGQQQAEAEILLSRVGLDAEVVPTFDEVVRPGEVLGSEPLAGRRAPPDGVVILEVSAGPAPRTVPAIEGKSGLEVLAELGRLDLLPGDVTFDDSTDATVGAALAVDPSSGSEVARYTTVDVVIAGPVDPTEMPSVEGLLESTARSVLGESSVSARFRRVSLPTGDPRSGRVIRQGLPTGAEVPPGFQVEIVVGIAPPPPTTTTTAPPTTTTAPTTTTPTTVP